MSDATEALGRCAESEPHTLADCERADTWWPIAQAAEAADREAPCILRNTPEDRERLAAALWRYDPDLTPDENADLILAEPTPEASDACPICGWVHTAEQGHVVDGKNA